jgi:hypothetical protein
MFRFNSRASYFYSMKALAYSFLLLCLLSCTNVGVENPKRIDTANPPTGKLKSPCASTEIKVASLGEKYKRTPIQLYNADGSLWMDFVVNDTFDSDSLYPIALSGEYNLLVFEVIGQTEDMFCITVNEKTSLVKYLKKNLDYFDYETWQEHILNTAFAIEFNLNANPLRSSPSATSPTLRYDADEFHHPLEIKDDWLKVEDSTYKAGWIKWKDANDELLITILYVS